MAAAAHCARAWSAARWDRAMTAWPALLNAVLIVWFVGKAHGAVGAA